MGPHNRDLDPLAVLAEAQQQPAPVPLVVQVPLQFMPGEGRVQTQRVDAPGAPTMIFMITTTPQAAIGLFWTLEAFDKFLAQAQETRSGLAVAQRLPGA